LAGNQAEGLPDEVFQGVEDGALGDLAPSVRRVCDPSTKLPAASCEKV